MSQKERKTLVLARVESTPGVDAILANLSASPAPFATDALLCSAFDVMQDQTALTRANYNPSFSDDLAAAGRVMGKFTLTTELRASGVFGVPARIGRLLKGCGMSETIIPAANAAAQISSPLPLPLNSSAAIAAAISGLTKTTAPTSRYDRYRITITTGGAAATAKYIVTGAGYPEGETTICENLDHCGWVSVGSAMSLAVTGTLASPVYTLSGTPAQYDQVELIVGGVRFFYQLTSSDTTSTAMNALKLLIAADARFSGTTVASNVITVVMGGAAGEITSSASSQVVTLGSSGAQVTLPAAMPGTFVAGEGFEIVLRRPGVRYDPVSDNSTTLTLWAYTDGSLYRLTRAVGTFAGTGNGGQYPTIAWTFTGILWDTVDTAIPTGVSYENSMPYKVELAELSLSGLSSVNARASKFSFDIANTITPNDDINAADAYSTIEITDRKPVFGVDPEAVAPGVFNPWSRMRRGLPTRVGVTIGKRGGSGNQIRVQADRASYTGAPMQNRNGIKTNDLAFAPARVSGDGNDEMHITFY